jgi:hypothetical protein
MQVTKDWLRITAYQALTLAGGLFLADFRGLVLIDLSVGMTASGSPFPNAAGRNK